MSLESIKSIGLHTIGGAFAGGVLAISSMVSEDTCAVPMNKFLNGYSIPYLDLDELRLIDGLAPTHLTNIALSALKDNYKLSDTIIFQGYNDCVYFKLVISALSGIIIGGALGLTIGLAKDHFRNGRMETNRSGI